ncbi:hypothetical protein B6I21_05070 [candidate division KSB1 bacterium 4572_119]|nr:MAG: hypothetical protein B6I21_05070 [candidate division KSB1 bacterium 4572_119]
MSVLKIVKYGNIFLILILSFIIFLFFNKTLQAQIVEIYDISPEQIDSKSFKLKKPMTLKIEATMGAYRSKHVLLSNCWILDSESREVVWEFPKRETDNKRLKRMIIVEKEINLPKGFYEVYFAINPSRYSKGQNLFNYIFDRNYSKKYQSSEWGVSVTAASKSDREYFLPNEKPREDQSVIQITNIFNKEYHKKGFSITAPAKFKIYAIGEGLKSGRQMYDFGWISDAKTKKRIWEMKYAKTDHAGGAIKNRKFEGRLTLPAGDYFVHYVTDDSHSNEEWNQMPPYDPNYYGITLWALEENFDYTEIKPLEKNTSRPPIIELTRMRNNRFVSEGFQISKETKFHIFALGESSGSQRGMADFGWIVNATTRETVWQMKYKSTEYAGGGKKNRVFDGYLTLPPGKYLTYYRTDDSHAFQSWNVEEPWTPESWGITISCIDESCQENIQTFEETNDPDILAQMIRIRDDDEVYKTFSLNMVSKVRIYCIGEGRNGSMFDYGWIENSTGKKVWEMEFEDTDHAGGGKKNRIINEVISLNPGKYFVYYKTDDSHSYNEWNTSPPDDREHWGITLIRQSK